MALGAVILLLSAAVGAEPLTSIPNPRTRDGTWVTDMPGGLRADTIARLNSTIGEFERRDPATLLRRAYSLRRNEGGVRQDSRTSQYSVAVATARTGRARSPTHSNGPPANTCG